jgi:hypothetical protein
MTYTRFYLAIGTMLALVAVTLAILLRRVMGRRERTLPMYLRKP